MKLPLTLTPLHLAAFVNNPALVEALLGARADAAKRITGLLGLRATARDVAVRFDRRDALAVLDDWASTRREMPVARVEDQERSTTRATDALG